MYLPSHFAVTDLPALHGLMRAHPLAALVRSGPQGLDADHLPFELDATAGRLGMLSAHVARANPLWQDCVGGAEVMVIFRGEQAYVSPNWYPSKHESHRLVPTWNYEVVQVHGRLTVLDDERFVRGLLARLTRHHEAEEARPWKMGDSAPAFIDELLQKVVGIRIEIQAITGKFKLSQNREPRDRLQAADTLASRGQMGLAKAMRDTG